MKNKCLPLSCLNRHGKFSTISATALGLSMLLGSSSLDALQSPLSPGKEVASAQEGQSQQPEQTQVDSQSLSDRDNAEIDHELKEAGVLNLNSFGPTDDMATPRKTTIPMKASSQKSSDALFFAALESTYKTNSDLQSALREYYATVENIPQARAGWLPNLGITGSGSSTKNFTDTKNSDPSTLGSDRQTTNTRNLSIGATLKQNLYQGGQTVYGLQAAELKVLAAQQTFVTAEQNALLQGVQAYLSLWSSLETLKAREASVKFNSRALEQVRAQAEVGERTRTDVAEAEASLAAAISDRLVAQAAVDTARASYFQVTGLESPESLPNPIDLFNNDIMPTSLAQMKERVEKTNPTVLGAAFSERSQEKTALQAEGVVKPSVDFSLQGSKSRSIGDVSRTLAATDNGKFSNRNYTKQGQALVEITIPIYQQGTEWSKIRQSYQQYYQTRNVLAQQRKIAQSSAVQAWQQWQAYGKSIEQRRIRIKAAELTLEGRRQEYLVGERTLTDVFDAERELRNAQVDLATATQQYIVSGYQVLQLVGLLLPDALGLGVARYDIIGYTQDQASKLFGTGDLRTPENASEPGFFTASSK